MIRVQGLVKQYGNKPAVHKLDLEIAQGEIFGLLGPNGAGKTTTIRMLTTLSRPDQGSIHIAGLDTVKDRHAVRMLIGVAPQERNLDMELSVQENLSIFAGLYNLDHTQKRIDNCLAQFELQHERHTQVDKLSGGMQRRLLIARALLSQPLVLFLDEPSIGLDPQIRRGIWDQIKVLRNQGVTILLTTHYMDEAEMLCDRIGLMNNGALLVTDTPRNLQITAGSYMVETPQPDGIQRTLCHDRQQAEELASLAAGAILRPASLEDAFIALTGQE